MTVTVSLDEVVDELDALADESTAYLNRETGELYAVRDDEAGMIEDDVDPEDLPEWLGDEVPKIREVLESNAWLALPTKFDIHEWAIMDDFARSVDDSDLRDQLMTAIRGRGAFRCFKDAVHRRGIQQDWYSHRDSALGRIAADWLDQHEVPYIDDVRAVSASRVSDQGIG